MSSVSPSPELIFSLQENLRRIDTGSRFKTQPTSEESGQFVSTSDLKDWMRVDLSDDDSLIAGLESAAREYVQNYTKLKLLRTTLAVKYGFVPDNQVFTLPFGPAFYGSASDLSVQYIDEAGATQTLDASTYVALTNGDFIPTLHLVLNKSWPTVADQAGSITITYKCGFGVADPITTLNVEPLKLAIKKIVAHWYEHREAAEPMMMHKPPIHVDRILDQYTTQRAY